MADAERRGSAVMELDTLGTDLNNGDPRGLFARYLDAVGRRWERPFTAFRAGQTVLPDGVLLPTDPTECADPAGSVLADSWSRATPGLPSGRFPVWLRVEPDEHGDPHVVLVVVPFGERTAVRWSASPGGDCPVRSGLLCLGPAAADPSGRRRLLALARPEIARRGRPVQEPAGLPPVAPAPGAFRKGWQVLADPATGAELVGLLTRARHGVQAVGHDVHGEVAAYVLDLTG